jgi:hypothetical protein
MSGRFARPVLGRLFVPAEHSVPGSGVSWDHDVPVLDALAVDHAEEVVEDERLAAELAFGAV